MQGGLLFFEEPVRRRQCNMLPMTIGHIILGDHGSITEGFYMIVIETLNSFIHTMRRVMRPDKILQKKSGLVNCLPPSKKGILGPYLGGGKLGA